MWALPYTFVQKKLKKLSARAGRSTGELAIGGRAMILGNKSGSVYRLIPVWLLVFMVIVAFLMLGPCKHPYGTYIVTPGFSQEKDFIYRSTVIRILDGDTLGVLVSVPVPWGKEGMFLVIPELVRICCIDAPETSKAQAKCEKEVSLGGEAKEYLSSILKPMIKVLLSDVGRDKYGRILAKVTTLEGQDVGTIMISKGLAKSYSGGKKPDWCSKVSKGGDSGGKEAVAKQDHDI